MVRYALIALGLAVAPVALVACGGAGSSQGASPEPVAQEEAAPCVSAVKAAQGGRDEAKVKAQAAWRERWPSVTNPTDYIIQGPDDDYRSAYPSAAPRADYYAQVRADCTERVLPVALAATGIQTVTLDDACRYDPYRESRLCADLPQPGAGD